MKLEELKNKKIIILGFGVEGKSVYDFLAFHFPNKEITITDQKNGDDYLEKQKKYTFAIKSPGIHKSKVTIPYTTAVNIFLANVKGMVVGVTGSKGKSTTSSLIYSLLKQAGKKVHLVGNITHKQDAIGQPMLNGLIESNDQDDIWVCELSSFMLDDIQYSPHISVVTSFFPEHMDYHGSVEAYLYAKKNILKFATEKDYFVYNPKCRELQKLAEETNAAPIPFLENVPFSEKIIPLKGNHNLDNVKGAVTVAEILQIPENDIVTAIKNFVSLPHRLENVGTFQGVTFYDDAISTTPQSTIQALETVQNIGTIFLGGQDRGYDFSELGKIIAKSTIKNIVLFPESGEKIYDAITKNTEKQFHVLRTTNMEEAVRFAYAFTQRNTICLLSTASPSYTVWENFEEKGNLFKKFVQLLVSS